jgi:nitrogen fixation protein
VPELPQPRLSNAAQSATGVSLPPEQVLRPFPYGWSVNVPELPQPRLSNAAQSATGVSLPPEQVLRPFPYGWSIAIPDLPQFKRVQALPELSGRIDKAPIPPPFINGWSIAIPDLPQFKRTLSGAIPAFGAPSGQIISNEVDFLCANTVQPSAYFTAAIPLDRADYAAGGFDSADYSGNPFDAPYDMVGGFLQFQLYGSAANDNADYQATRNDVSYFKVTTSEMACHD